MRLRVHRIPPPWHYDRHTPQVRLYASGGDVVRWEGGVVDEQRFVLQRGVGQVDVRGDLVGVGSEIGEKGQRGRHDEDSLPCNSGECVRTRLWKGTVGGRLVRVRVSTWESCLLRH
nr:hypothetical protein CFP56_64757 [Quercus suber]